tara:strand:+ start:168 stop:653 length:486 start_codon:yes stop_codon:yes gene_type:complete
MSLQITGAEKLYRNIDKVARWSIEDSQKLQDVGHRVGAVYANYIKANVKDLGKDTRLRGKLIKDGQLRRSGGTWLPNKKRNTVLAGPRTNAVGGRKVKNSANGFYAHIVEKGDFGPRFGGKHRTQNTGVFEKGMNATRSRSEKLQLMLLRQNFVQFTRGML